MSFDAPFPTHFRPPMVETLLSQMMFYVFDKKIRFLKVLLPIRNDE